MVFQHNSVVDETVKTVYTGHVHTILVKHAFYIHMHASSSRSLAGAFGNYKTKHLRSHETFYIAYSWLYVGMLSLSEMTKRTCLTSNILHSTYNTVHLVVTTENNVSQILIP